MTCADVIICRADLSLSTGRHPQNAWVLCFFKELDFPC
jgi:hypothetical protein